jgi:hypothetical protein
MIQLARQFFLGAASLILAPIGLLPAPKYRITVPERTARDALAGDFARVAADFRSAHRTIEKRVQMEMELSA